MDLTGSHAMTLRRAIPLSGSCCCAADSTAFGKYNFPPTSAKASRESPRPMVPLLPFGDVVPGHRVRAALLAGNASTFWYCDPGPKIAGRMVIVSLPPVRVITDGPG